MIWIVYGLLSALCIAIGDAVAKKLLSHSDEYVITWARYAYAVPVLLIGALFTGISPITDDAWLMVAIGIPLEIIAIMLYVRAMKISPLSLVMPFLSLTPVFLLLTSFIILKESPSATGIAGVVFIAAGAYVLNISRIRQGVYAPLKAIFTEKGCIFMIIAAFIYSLTANIIKLGIMNTGIVMFSTVYMAAIGIAYTPIVLAKAKNIAAEIRKNNFWLMVQGACFALMIIFNLLALQLTIVPYAQSLKRMSVLISVIMGYMIFNEGNIKERLGGALLMLAGIMLIALF